MKAALVCEDDPAIATLLEVLLSRMQLAVTVTRNGDEALRLLREKAFDLFVLDLLMPVRNGYAVLEELRRDLPALLPRTIVATATAGLQSGRVDDVAALVVKPFDVEKFQLLVAKTLKHIDG